MWGAFWGVLFALFALLFLTYNRKKFYKKNPEWDKFKQNNNMVINEDEDGEEKRIDWLINDWYLYWYEMMIEEQYGYALVKLFIA